MWPSIKRGITDGDLLNRLLDIVISIVAWGFVIYHTLNVILYFQGSVQHYNTHLMLALTVVFLTQMKKNKKRSPIFFVLLLLSLASTLYIQFSYDELIWRPWAPILTDIIFGSILVLLVFLATKITMGNVLPIVALILIAYAFLGRYLPGPLEAYHLSWQRIIHSFATTTNTGIYGTILGVSANYLVLFFIFASMISGTGAVQFFHEIAKWLSRKISSGAAMGAVVTSCMVGMVTGNPGPNVAITGSFTIPAMKKAGYKPEEAGGIEAVASTGGQIMPPVLGAAAFVMSAFTGIPYWSICAAVFIPALLYYLSAGFYVHFTAKKRNIKSIKEEVNVRELLASAPSFILPLSVLSILLAINFSPAYAAFWTIICTVGVSLFRKQNRTSLKRWTQTIIDSASTAAMVAVGCALLGIIVEVTSATGLGMKLPFLIKDVGQGNMYVMLFLIAITSLLLGCGLPGIAVYILMASLMSPVLVEMGFSLLQAHLFPFYYGAFAAITLPVAVAAIIASSMAGATYMKTGWEAMKVGVGAFVLPFLIIWAPSLLLKPAGGIVDTILEVIGAVLLTLTAQMAITGWFLSNLSVLSRVFSGVIVVLVLAFFAMHSNLLLFLVSIVLFTIILAVQLHRRRILAKQETILTSAGTST